MGERGGVVPFVGTASHVFILRAVGVEQVPCRDSHAKILSTRPIGDQAMSRDFGVKNNQETRTLLHNHHINAPKGDDFQECVIEVAITNKGLCKKSVYLPKTTR